MADSEFFYEKEAEYFGFTPFQFLDAVGEIVVKTVFGMFERLPTSANKAALTLATKNQLESGLAQWSALVEGRFSRNYDLFESYVTKNVLLLPDSFVLPSYRENPKLIGDSNERALDEEIKTLLAGLQTETLLQAQLEAEELRINDEGRHIQNLEKELDQLRNLLILHKLDTFEIMTSQLTEKLAALQNIVVDTIELGKNLHTFEDTEGDLDYLRALERRLYITADHRAGMEHEWNDCQKIATFADITCIYDNL